MEIATIIELIGTVGFPIACVLALGIFVYKLWQQSVTRETLLMNEITANREINKQFATIIAQHSVQLEEIKDDVREIKQQIIYKGGN